MWFEKGKQYFRMDAQTSFADILRMKSHLFLPKLSNSQINRFLKACSEREISDKVGLSTQLNLIKSSIENHVDNLKFLFNTHS